MKEYKSGLSRTSVIAILYSMLVFVPASMYLTLMTGEGGVAGSWFIILLFVEIGRFAGLRLTKQEAAIMMMFAGGIQFATLGLIYRAYFVQSDVARMFGLQSEIPYWFAPGKGSEAFELRNLLHPDFLLPNAIFLVFSLLAVPVGLAMSFFASEIYVETENLPFPIQQMRAKTVLVLTEEERKSPLNVLSVAAVGGMIFGIAVYALPFILMVSTNRSYSESVIIPVPWVDLTPNLSDILPGAIFGIATTIPVYTLGFIVSFPHVLQVAIASIAIYFIGNWVTVIQNPPYGPHDWWAPGMSASQAAQRSILYNWSSFTIGLTIAAGIIPLLAKPQLIKRALLSSRSSSEPRERRTQPIPGGPKLAVILPLVLGLGFFCALYIFLVPDYAMQHLWILPFFVGMLFFQTLVSGRGRGEVGIGVGAGPVVNIIYFVTGASTPVWFAPQPLAGTGARATAGYGFSNSAFGTWTGTPAQLKFAELTELNIKSIIKVMLIFVPIASIVSLAFAQAFWSLAPIPSAQYPGAAIYWPIEATYTALWIGGREAGLLNPTNMLIAFVVGSALHGVGLATHLPISLISLAAGANTLPPVGVGYLVGGIMALVLRRVVGKETWEEYKLLLAGGMSLGMGVAITLSISIALVINSLWVFPY